ncbi:MAG: glycosyltransferase family 2 protein [Desulfobacteraceae bacterium]|nr:glycosyltransferase family 2 protein [Desulfobacteraceae bacterium]
MKLIIQIPCYGEAETIEQTVRDLPVNIEGIDTIEYLVIDDGSTDGTYQIAERAGVHHVIRQDYNKGLASTFAKGIAHAISLGADIVVNTDGDNQYCGKDIAKLVQPILEKKADIVIGCRPITNHPEFSFIKKGLQHLGSWVLRKISKTTVRDAASGFRAFTREACMRLYVHSNFSYCMETLIQAGNSGLKVTSVDIDINPKTRDSRLFSNIFQYILKSGATMVSMFVLYRPGSFFLLSSLSSFFIATVLGVRYLYLVFIANAPDPFRTYLPSLILLSIFATFGMILTLLGVYGELSKAQRRLLEEIIINQRKYLINGSDKSER